MKKTIAYVLLALLAVSLLGGCNKKSASSAKNDITAQIEEMLGTSYENEESGIFGELVGNNQIFSDDEYGRKISEKVEYKITSVDVAGERGTVTVEIKSPDVYAILEEAASEMSSDADVDMLLVRVSEKLESSHPEISETVTCEIKFQNEKWKLVLCTELLDALSGNLYSAYMGIADDVIGSVEEG